MILADIAVAITLPIELFRAEAAMMVLLIFADMSRLFAELLVFLFGNGNLLIQRVQINKTCFSLLDIKISSIRFGWNGGNPREQLQKGMANKLQP